MSDSNRHFLGQLEHMVGATVFRYQGQAYGMLIVSDIETRTGFKVSIGAVYATLDRLEKKGLIEATNRGATLPPEESISSRRHKNSYALTDKGMESLIRFRNAVDAVWEGLDPHRESSRAEIPRLSKEQISLSTKTSDKKMSDKHHRR